MIFDNHRHLALLSTQIPTADAILGGQNKQTDLNDLQMV